jgi:hypothetical protein
MDSSEFFSLSLIPVLKAQREHFVLSLQDRQTSSLSNMAGSSLTIRLTVQVILVCNAQARRLTETVEKSENCGVYMMYTS